MENADEESGDVQAIPHDLIFDILARLPVKSLTRFRSVSTRWNSTISDPSFVEAHFSRSLATRPTALTLLLTFPNRFHTERLIFSATIPTDQTQSLPSTHHLTIPGFVHPYVSLSLQGLICLEIGSLMRICNPSNREFVTLPSTTTETPHPSSCSCYRSDSFGFDPVRNKHKVLDTWMISTGDPENEMIMEHRVFTVGSNQWRRISDGPPHFPGGSNNVCINGFIYYRSWTSMAKPSPLNHVLVAFDVGAEEFHFIDLPDPEFALVEESALIEFDTHLALVDYQGLKDGNNLEFWVLEDEKKLRWVKRSVVFPENWSEMKDGRSFYLAGTISTGEMIFGPRSLAKPFYVICYDVKSNSLRRIEICGLPEHELRFGTCFISISVTDHVESILSFAELGY